MKGARPANTDIDSAFPDALIYFRYALSCRLVIIHIIISQIVQKCDLCGSRDMCSNLHYIFSGRNPEQSCRLRPRSAVEVQFSGGLGFIIQYNIIR